MSFNDHVGYTTSYKFTREHEVESEHTDFMPLRREITMPETHEEVTVVQMHDGTSVRLWSTAPEDVPFEKLSPGKAALEKLVDRYR